MGDVRLDGRILTNWTNTGFPLDNYDNIYGLLAEGKLENDIRREKTNKEFLHEGPTIFHGTFDISLEAAQFHDTYLNPVRWGKVSNHVGSHISHIR